MHPLALFDRVRIINLDERRDRRRDVTRQIERIGGFDGGRIAFETVTRPDGPDGFPSVGARGCFTSHLGILRDFLRDGGETLLILEDDFDFAPDLARVTARLERLRHEPWEMFEGAYVLTRGTIADDRPIGVEAELRTSSFVAFTRAGAERMTAYLESLLAGHPPGRIHVDGAYNEFRWAHPHVPVYAAVPALGRQRSSASSITPGRFDRVPVVRGVVALLRRLRG